MKNVLRTLFLFISLLIITSIATAQWVEITSPWSTQGWTGQVTSSGTHLYMTQNDTLIVSTDNGISWTRTHYPGGINIYLVQDSIGQTNVFLRVYDVGLYLSTNSGTSWRLVDSGITKRLWGFSGYGGQILLLTADGVFRSTNNGETWSPTDSLPSKYSGGWIYVSHSRIFVHVYNTLYDGKVYSSTNDGESWELANVPLYFKIDCMAQFDSYLFAGTHKGIYRSTNDGGSWEEVNTGLTGLSYGSIEGVTELIFSPDSSGTIFAVVNPIECPMYCSKGNGGGIFVSSNNGERWTAVNNGLNSLIVPQLFIWNNSLYAETYDGNPNKFLYHAGFGRRPLSEIMNMPAIYSVADVPNDQGGKVSLYWTATHLDTNTTTLPYYSIWRSITPTSQLAPPSSDINKKLPNSVYRTITVDGKEYAWELIGKQDAHRFKTYSFTVPTLFDSMSTTDGKHYFLVSAHTSDPNVFYDSNIESGYSVDNLSPSPPQNFAGNHVGNTFVLRWDANSESDIDHYEIYRSGNLGFNPDTMTSLATMNGTSFTDNMMLPIPTYYYAVRAVDIHGNRSAKSAEVATVLVGVDEAEVLPTEFSLSQNYPNPFNPSTTIRYQLPMQSNVTLKIFDLLGREVATLVKDMETAGYKYVVFDASALPSGVCFYRLQAGGYVNTKKLLLLK